MRACAVCARAGTLGSSKEALELLVAWGASAALVDTAHGESALHVACRHGQVQARVNAFNTRGEPSKARVYSNTRGEPGKARANQNWMTVGSLP